jgi:amidohydrolase
MSLQSTLEEYFKWFHRRPEIGNTEYQTTARIREILAAAGVEALDIALKTGVVAHVSGVHPGPVVALRADIDALPVTEDTGLPYASEYAGRMHACGHDFHLTSLLGAALLLQERRAEFAGTVKLIFQPAEESAAGALQVLAAGVLDDVAEIYGAHVRPDLPAGVFAVSAGGVWAAVGKFTARFRGTGGHAAYPQHCRDSIVAAAQFITALQTIVSRSTNPFDSAVVSVTHIEAGNTWNVIPGDCFIEGTFRALSNEGLNAIAGRIGTIAHGVAEAAGIVIDFAWDCTTVAVNNDAALTNFVADTAHRLGYTVAPAVPTMGGEDFARYQERIPGVFWSVGVGSPQALHNPGFVADLSPLAQAAELLAAVATARLAKLAIPVVAT